MSNPEPLGTVTGLRVFDKKDFDLKAENMALNETVRMLTRSLEQQADTERNLTERNTELETDNERLRERVRALVSENIKVVGAAIAKESRIRELETITENVDLFGNAGKQRLAERVLAIVQKVKTLAYSGWDDDSYSLVQWFREIDDAPALETAEAIISLLFADDLAIYEACSVCDKPIGTYELAIANRKKFCRATELGCHDTSHQDGCPCEVA